MPEEDGGASIPIGGGGKLVSFVLCGLVVLCMLLVHGWAEVLNARAGNPFETQPVRRWRSSLTMDEEGFRRSRKISPPGRALTPGERKELNAMIAQCSAYEDLCKWAGVATLVLLLVPLVLIWSAVMIIRGPLWRRLASPALALLAFGYAWAYVWRFTLD